MATKESGVSTSGDDGFDVHVNFLTTSDFMSSLELALFHEMLRQRITELIHLAGRLADEE